MIATGDRAWLSPRLADAIGYRLSLFARASAHLTESERSQLARVAQGYGVSADPFAFAPERIAILKKTVAGLLDRRVRELKGEKTPLSPDSEIAWPDSPGPWTLYYAYGSNINPEQMRQRCPGAQSVCFASLTDWGFYVCASLTAAVGAPS